MDTARAKSPESKLFVPVVVASWHRGNDRKRRVVLNLRFRLSHSRLFSISFAFMSEIRFQQDSFNAQSSAIAVPLANLLIFNKNPPSHRSPDRLFAMNLLQGLQNAVQAGRHVVNLFSVSAAMARKQTLLLQPSKYFAICGKRIQPFGSRQFSNRLHPMSCADSQFWHPSCKRDGASAGAKSPTRDVSLNRTQTEKIHQKKETGL